MCSQKILRNTLAQSNHETDASLSLNITLFCRQTMSPHSLSSILRHPSASLIHEAEVVLREGNTLLCAVPSAAVKQLAAAA